MHICKARFPDCLNAEYFAKMLSLYCCYLNTIIFTFKRDHLTSVPLIYNVLQGKHILREVGLVRSVAAGPDDGRTLASMKFQTGDYLDIALLI